MLMGGCSEETVAGEAEMPELARSLSTDAGIARERARERGAGGGGLGSANRGWELRQKTLMAAGKRRAGEGTGGGGARPAAAAEEEEEAAARLRPRRRLPCPCPSLPRKLFLENVPLPSPPGVFKFQICCL
jgi:hypothetical protein